MYAQVVRAQFQPGKADEAVAIFRDSVFPAVRQRQGFKAVYFLVDREANRGTAFALYETKEDVESLVTSGFFQEQAAKFEGVFAAPPEREVYEIAAQA